MPTAEDIDALLPQTQCTRCNFPSCREYAGAIARDEAPINQCPPGGAATIAALAALLSRPVLPLNPANGAEGPPQVAVIDEARCIGCAKCLPPCPVDAIVGAHRYLHTVMAALCTGCELCIAPCPVDCIAMIPATAIPPAALSRARFRSHTARLASESAHRAQLLAARKRSAAMTPGQSS